MNPTQMAALMMQLADLRIERDGARMDNMKLKQENDQLKAKIASLTTDKEEQEAVVEP